MQQQLQAALEKHINLQAEITGPHSRRAGAACMDYGCMDHGRAYLAEL